MHAGARLGGCNGSFPLWNDTAGKVPSPILNASCNPWPCTRTLDSLCTPPAKYWNGYFGKTTCNLTERDTCTACLAKNNGATEDAGCGFMDRNEYCQTALPAQPDPATCVGALRDNCGPSVTHYESNWHSICI